MIPHALLVLLALVSALGPMSIDMGLPALPALEQSFGLESGQGALTLTLFLLGFGISPVVSGLLSDRFGRKRVLTLSLFGFSVLALLCYLASSFTWLLIFRLLQGVFAGASVALPIAIVRDQASEASAGPHIAKISMIVGLAPMVAPALGTLVLEFSGWRGIFLTQALLGLALTGYTARVLAEPPGFTASHVAGIVDVLHRARLVYSTRGFLAPTLIYATLFSAIFSFLVAAPAVFIESYGFSEYQLVAVLALTSFGMFAGSLLNSYLLKHGYSRPMTLIRIPCAAAAAAATVLLLTTALTGQPHYGLVVACCWLCIFTFGISAPSANHQAIYALSTNKGLGAGFIRTTQMLLAAAAGSGVSILALTFNALLASAIMMTVMAWAALLTLLRWNRVS